MSFVLITRPAEDTRRTAIGLQAHGLRGLAAPVLDVETLAGGGPASIDFHAIILTSSNAVRGLSAAIAARGIPEDWSSIPTIAVGDRTAAVARAAGFAKTISAQGDGPALMALCAQTLRPASRLLHVTGVGLGADLRQGLEDLGHNVVRWEIYETRPARRLPVQARQLIAQGRVTGGLIMSPRSASAFTALAAKHRLWSALRNTKFACISKATADSLLDSVGPKALFTVCIAQRPDLASTIDAFLSTRRPLIRRLRQGPVIKVRA